MFLDVVSLGVAEWTTAALYQIGRTYETFASRCATRRRRRVSRTPTRSVPDADRRVRRSDRRAEPRRLRERLEEGDRARDLQQWTAKMREALGRLNAELYPPFKEIGFEIRSSGPAHAAALIDWLSAQGRRRAGSSAPAAAKTGGKK